MDERSGSSAWISAYLEWTDGGEQADESAAVYMEWADAPPQSTQREAVLLLALRTESEFMRILRQALEDESRMDWRCALKDVEADVRALSGRIRELRVH